MKWTILLWRRRQEALWCCGLAALFCWHCVALGGVIRAGGFRVSYSETGAGG